MNNPFSMGILFFSILFSEDSVVDEDILERYTQLCTRIEWSIKSDHEYYMTDLERSYFLQSIRHANDQLYYLLLKDPVQELELVNEGKDVLNVIERSKVKQQYSLPKEKQKSNVTYYSFSSIN